MKKELEVTPDFIRYHRQLVKLMDLKIGDTVSIEVKSAKGKTAKVSKAEAEDDGLPHPPTVPIKPGK